MRPYILTGSSNLEVKVERRINDVDILCHPGYLDRLATELQASWVDYHDQQITFEKRNNISYVFMPTNKKLLPIDETIGNTETDYELLTDGETLYHAVMKKRVCCYFILPRDTLAQTVSNWQKHIADYHNWSKQLYLEQLDDIKIHHFYQKRLQEHREKDLFRKKKNISLNKPAAKFFGNKVAVPYFYNHDKIHEVIAFTEEPIYRKMLVPGAEVLTGQKRMQDLTKEEMVMAVVEEATVLGLERLLLPFFCNWKGPLVTTDEAFYYGLMRICTNITSGFFETEQLIYM